MELILKKSKLAVYSLYLIFVLSVFVDMYNGYAQHYSTSEPIVGILYKGLLLFLCFATCVQKRWTKFFRNLVLILFFYLFLFCCWAMYDNNLKVQQEIVFAIKIYFPYVILAFLFEIDSRTKFKTNDYVRILSYYGVIAAISIILSSVLKVGISSYGDVDAAFGFGSKGFFTAGNDIGLVLLMTNCMLCYLYVVEKKSKYLVQLILVSLSSVMIGTMTGILGTIGLWATLTFYIVFISKRLFSKIQKSFLIIFLISIVLSIGSYFFKILTEDAYFMHRLGVFSQGDSRTTLADAADKVLGQFSFTQWLTGIGYTSFSWQVGLFRNEFRFRLTEMDLYDLIGYYGVTLGGIILAFAFYVFYKCFVRYNKTKSAFYFWMLALISIFILHGALAGHAFTSPQCSLIYCGIVFIVLRKKEEVLH